MYFFQINPDPKQTWKETENPARRYKEVAFEIKDFNSSRPLQLDRIFNSVVVADNNHNNERG